MTPQEKTLLIDEILAAHYGAPFIPFSYRDPLSELVSAMLSHRTRNAVTRVAYLNLKERFATWEEVIEAPTDEVEEAIRGVTFPEVKAPRIQQALREVAARNMGELSLEGLHEVSVEEARSWLEAIPGVGAKTSAAVLSFSHLRMPALVVDTHHHRVALRLGLVPAKSSLDKTARILQAFIPEDWDGQRVYDSHQGFMRHGQKVCHWRKPNCQVCIVREYCDHYAAQNATSEG
ncbi:endonuclease III [Neolewinella aurantiaca]|uniref:Endonuclease III n=1 Tax=Neolewinella aurantiaca TaxID=2602767 RepID=A0A5C7FJH0_9BACT|nr:endonuclease III [Neolewinella aurantiaca]TXF91435.1 endonuclease III [Neolewinella aurantiaca]